FTRRSDAFAVLRISNAVDCRAVLIEVRYPLSFGYIPNQNRAISVCRNKPAAIRRKGNTPHQRIVFEGRDPAFGPSVPQNHILRGAGRQLAIWRKCHRTSVVFVSLKTV